MRLNNFLMLMFMVFFVPLAMADDTFTISGSESEASGQVNVGETVILSGELTSTKILDSDMSDGHLLYLYGQYALINSSGDVLAEQGSQQISSTTYAFSFDHTFNKVGDYKLGYAISFVELQYNESTQQWVQVASGVDTQNSEEIEVLYPNPADQSGLLDSIVASLNSAWSNFLTWLKGLF